ncbi:MAG: ParB/RepB/Spo0J family partition protein, partial [Eubacterium sp.]|nr:ParB/RepB/Spo0J family partition protein [Eubacterium sp.]
IQREDLNPIEEALAYQNLTDEFGLKHEDVARRVSKSRAAVTNSLRLLKLDPAVQNMLIDGRLSMGHARALLALPESVMQQEAAEKIASSGISVRETEKLVKQLLNPKAASEKSKKEAQMEAVYAGLEKRLREVLGTRVVIKPIRGKKGTVEIEYYTNEDLEKILDNLMS